MTESDGPWNNIAPIESLNLHARIAAQLEEMILTGKIQPGEHLPSEQRMAIQFAVSRSVIRDAIRVLSTRGLIEAHQGRQSIVTDNGRRTLREVLQLLIRRTNYTMSEMIGLRTMIEPEMARHAAEKANPSQIQRLEEALESYRTCLEKQDFRKAEEAHFNFHMALAFSNDNHLIHDVIGEIVRATALTLGPLIDLQNLWDDFNIHAELLGAIKIPDPDGAYRIMTVHMLKSADQLI